MNFFIFVLLVIAVCSNNIDAQASAVRLHEWYGVFEPTGNKSEVYGTYTGGCIDGAVALPESGDGYYNVNMLSNRSYGHPVLVGVIKNLGKKVKETYGRSILVGDLAHARGGPTSIKTSAHRSHQNGLDVDIWFENILSGEKAGDDVYPASILSKDRKSLSNKRWNEAHMGILKEAAAFGEVERILVNPYVKKAMCDRYKGAKWLNKLRPWWGHHKHFHLRVGCPAGSGACRKQASTPKSSGCGKELAWWFSKEAEEAGKAKSDKKRVYPRLPKQCEDVFMWE